MAMAHFFCPKTDKKNRAFRSNLFACGKKDFRCNPIARPEPAREIAAGNFADT
jgi:hypothetical protein